MRSTMLAALALAAVALSACQQSESQATEATPPPKKSLARQATFAEGQEQIQSIAAAQVKVDKSGVLVLNAEGQAPAPGYSKPTFVKRVYAAAPPDGIYEVDVVANKPASAGASGEASLEAKGEWPGFPKDRLKGVKFISKTNEVVAMLPATGGASGAQ